MRKYLATLFAAVILGSGFALPAIASASAAAPAAGPCMHYGVKC